MCWCRCTVKGALVQVYQVGALVRSYYCWSTIVDVLVQVNWGR